MPFIDIAYQAEVSRYEDPDFKEYAYRNCNESPETKQEAIEMLRNLIYERQECNPRRMDDAYLLRFLRCRRFIPNLAHKLMVRYEEFRKDNAYLYDCKVFELDKVKNVYGCALPESPSNGRITFMRFGRWDSDTVEAFDVVRSALFAEEIMSMQPKLQILGVTVVIDLKGVNLRHICKLTPTIAGQIVSLAGLSFPIPIRGVHVINYNWLFNHLCYIFKQFLPNVLWERIHFHGHDLTSLHRCIDPEYLPPEYGGSCRYFVKAEDFIAKINRYKDDFLVQDLRNLGYTIEENSDDITFKRSTDNMPSLIYA